MSAELDSHTVILYRPRRTLSVYAIQRQKRQIPGTKKTPSCNTTTTMLRLQGAGTDIVVVATNSLWTTANSIRELKSSVSGMRHGNVVRREKTRDDNDIKSLLITGYLRFTLIYQ